MPELLVIAVCLLINAVLSAAEMAFVTTGKPRLRELQHHGPASQKKAARRALELRENPERTLSVIQIGITLVGAIAAAVGGAGAEEGLQPMLQRTLGLDRQASQIVAIVLVVVPLTYLSVVIGELVPKSLALRRPLEVLLRCARGLSAFEKVFAPIVSIFEWSTRRVLSLVSGRPRRSDMSAASSEMVELGTLTPQTREYVLNLVRLENKKVRDVYVPWPQTVRVRQQDRPEDVQAVVLSSGHTRLPVVDAEDRVLGIVNTKEFMAWDTSPSGPDAWMSLLRPAVLVSEQESLFRAFRSMQEKRSHLAVVTAPGGPKPLGIVTMEDVLEEIIGDIYDEDDDGRLRRLLAKN